MQFTVSGLAGKVRADETLSGEVPGKTGEGVVVIC